MSTTSAGPYVPPGQYPPYEVVTSTDHAAWIIIVTSLCLSTILVFSGIHIFIRWSVVSTVGPEDVTLAISTVLAFIQGSVILGACAEGLGKSFELVSDGNLASVQKSIYISMLLFYVALGLSKIAVGSLLLRLTPSEQHRRVFIIVLVSMAIWTVASLVATAFQCQLPQPWISYQQQCSGSFPRLLVISLFDIFFEICLVIMTTYLIWNLQTTPENKLAVIFSFGMRLPLIVPIIFRITTFHTEGFRANPTFLQTDFIIWTQVELCYSIIGSIIPSLRPFIKSLSTNYGTADGNRAGALGYGNTSGSGGNGYGSKYAVGSRYATGSRPSTRNGDIKLSNLRPKGDGDDYRSRIWSAKSAATKAKGELCHAKSENRLSQGNRDTDSLRSSESQRMIIKKDVEWEIRSQI